MEQNNASARTHTILPAEDLEQLSQYVSELRAIGNREATERMLRELDQRLQRCFARLGIFEGEIFDNAGLTGKKQKSRGYWHR